MNPNESNDKSVQNILGILEQKAKQYLEIKPSNISGQGVFTKAALNADMLICPIYYQIAQTGDPDQDYKRTEYGLQINHSITPNCDLEQEGNCFVLHTREEIEAGTELTINYQDTPWSGEYDLDADRSDTIMMSEQDVMNCKIIEAKGEEQSIYYPITQDEFDNGYVEFMESDARDGKTLFTNRSGMEQWIKDEDLQKRFPYYLRIRWMTDGMRIKGPGFYFITDQKPELLNPYLSFQYHNSFKFIFWNAFKMFTENKYRTEPDMSVTKGAVEELFAVDPLDDKDHLLQATIELFQTRIPKVKKIIQSVKKVTLDDYMKMMKPGDLMVTYPVTSTLDFGSRVFRNLNTFFQGSSFTSIKMVREDGKGVMGYSAVLNSHGALNENDIKTFAETTGGMCLIRPKKITDAQRQKAVKWMRAKLKQKLPYSQAEIVKSLLAHLLHISKSAVKLDRKEIRKYSDPLICSSIVGLAYEYAGINLKIPYSTFHVWPIDFLMSDQTEKVCCYFADGEYPDLIESKDDDDLPHVEFGFGVDIDKTVGDLISGNNSKNGLKIGSAEAQIYRVEKPITLEEIDQKSVTDLKELLVGINLASAASDDEDWTLDDLKKNIERKKEKRFYFLIREEKRIGIIAINNRDDMSWISNFAIFAKYQGKGYGLQSLLVAIDKIRENDPNRRIEIGVAKVNTRAYSLYKKVGFKVEVENDNGTSYEMSLTGKPKIQLKSAAEEEYHQTLEAENLSTKRQQIIDYVKKYFQKFDKTPVDNAKRFEDMIRHMSDKEFHEYMVALRDGKAKLAFYAPNMESHTSIDDLISVCKELGIAVQSQLKIHDPTTGKWFWTPDEYVILNIPVRRAQQFVDKKIGVPDNDVKIDALTGQVTQEDRSTSFTNPEIQMMYSRGLTPVLSEFIQIRGGNPGAYGEFRRQLEETGQCSMASIDANYVSRTARMAGVLFRSMHIDNNIVEEE